MSSWGKNDNATDAPKWAVNAAITKSPAAQIVAMPTAANVAILYGNTTPDAYITGETVGLFNIDSQEIQAQGHGLGAHAGWNLRTTGSGGRAGRVQHETLVVLANTTGDGDGQFYANVTITLSGPSNGSVTSGAANANTVSFTVAPTLTGNTAAALTYQWQVNSGVGAWVNMADGNNVQPGGVRKAGVTSATFLATPWNTTANNFVFRCIVTAADQGVSVTSSNAYITIY